MSRPPKHPGVVQRAGDSLTEREIQVLALVAAGERTHAIGERLGIAPNTVKAHLTSVYRKTGSRNRVQATRYYLEHYTSDPGKPSATVDPPEGGGEPSPLIRRQIKEIEARLDQLAPAANEVARLHDALSALRALEPH